ncbi:hypothetical protein D3C78_759630 [compost metagenome]
MVAAQGIELGGKAGEARVVVFQATFDEVNVFGNVVFVTRLVRKEGLDHVLSHTRPHQPRQVGFDTVAQAAQGVGTALVEGQVEITQGLFDFLLCGLGAQGLGQLRGEFLRRGGMQFAALRTAHVIHRARFGGADFFTAGVGEQRNQGEQQHVGRQRGNGRHVPAGVVEHIDHVQQRDVETLQVAHQWQQHGHHPHQDSGQQTGDEAATVGGRPVQYRKHAWQELQGGDKGDDAEVGQVLLALQGQVEAEAGGDDRDDQGAAGPFQPAIDIALGRWLVQRQHQVVQGHARKCQGGDDDQPAGGR